MSQIGGYLTHGAKGAVMDQVQFAYAAGLKLPLEDRKEIATLCRVAADFLEQPSPPPVEER